MNPRVTLLCIIVALCLGHVLSRGVEQKRIFSVNLEVVRPMDDCFELRNNNNNISKCELDLMDQKSATLENMANTRYLIKVKIGSKKQEFKVKIDTGSGPLWVFSTKCLDTNYINCKSHTKYDSSGSTSFKKIDEDFKITYGSGQVEGITSEDTVYLADGLEAKKQLFGAISKVTKKYEGYDGILGLNMMKTKGRLGVFNKAAEDAGMDPIFSVFIKGGGSSGNGGEITFGGINEAHIKKMDTKVEVKVVHDSMFVVQMDEVKFGDTSICKRNGDTNCRAHIDTGATQIFGPKAPIDKFNRDELEATGDHNKVDCKKIIDSPDIKITFGEKTLVLEPKYYIKKIGEICHSRLTATNGWWILGDAFLVKYYSVYNMKAGNPSVTLYEAK